jgi:hypothetical protein
VLDLCAGLAAARGAAFLVGRAGGGDGGVVWDGRPFCGPLLTGFFWLVREKWCRSWMWIDMCWRYRVCCGGARGKRCDVGVDDAPCSDLLFVCFLEGVALAFFPLRKCFVTNETDKRQLEIVILFTKPTLFHYRLAYIYSIGYKKMTEKYRYYTVRYVLCH